MTSSRSLSTRPPCPAESQAPARQPSRRGWVRVLRVVRALWLAGAVALPVRSLAEGDAPRVVLEGTAERPVPAEPPVIDPIVPLFPQATARYLGVTDPGGEVGGGLALPSQLEWYELLVAPRAAHESRVMVRAAPGPVATISPRPGLRLDAGGALSQAWRAPGSAFAATGFQATLADAPGSARARFALTAAQEIRGTTDEASAHFGSRSSAALKVRVAEPVSVTAEVHELSERAPSGDAVTTGGARAGATIAVVPRVLDVTASAGVDRVHTGADGATVDRSSAELAVTARLTPSLTLTGSEGIQTGDLTPAAGAAQLFPQAPAARITSGSAQWRVSERLQLTLQLSRLVTAAGVGAARQVRAVWTPVRDGLLRVAAAYEESIDAASGSRVVRAILQPSFRLNRKASIDASWTDTIQLAPGPVAHAQAFLVSFSIRT